MKRAVVLSGGGAKGGYEIGVWKALRRLDIDYDIVTGTSVGALIGELMVQKDYDKALKLWYFMDYSKVMDVEINGRFSTKKGREEIVKKYAKGAIKGGRELTGLKKIVDDLYDDDKFFSSNVDYGLVTVYFPSFKPKYVVKSKLKKDEVKDYLMASSACFPAFKMYKIGKNSFIDGGYYDNLPINLAIKLGAEEVIAVNTGAIGIIRKVKNDKVKIINIKPRNDIGNFLAFEKKYARRAIAFGYNDAMKTFGKLEGDLYTFRLGSLKRNYDRNIKRFISNVEKYIPELISKLRYKKILSKNNFDAFNKVLENTAKAFLIDEANIYRTSFLNMKIKREYIRTKITSFNKIKRKIKTKALKKNYINKELIIYIYHLLDDYEKNKNTIASISLFFFDAFLSAVYLKMIMR